MKTTFNYKGVHYCEAVVLTCIDFRFWREVFEFAKSDLGLKNFDFATIPGAAKGINDYQSKEDLAMKCIFVPFDLHEAKKVVIINHWDCGAYGGTKKFQNRKEEKKFHEEELQKAKEKILGFYPEKEVILCYADMDESEENLEILTIS